MLSKIIGVKLNKLFIVNSEIPNSKSNIKSSYSDLVLKCNNTEYIIEMNRFQSNILFYKNNHYLLKEHSNRSSRNNMYGKNNNTILINIDNFDLLGKNQLIYKSNFSFVKYNTVIYKNITSYYINLEYLKKKYYNKEKLNGLEELLLIFIEQRKDILLSIVKYKEVEDIVKSMEILKNEEQFLATYDRDEFEMLLKQEFEENKKNLKKDQIKLYQDQNELVKNQTKLEQDQTKLEQDQTKLEQDQTKLEQDQTKLEQDQTKLEQEKNKLDLEKNQLSLEKSIIVKEKLEIAKELKSIGYPISKIIKITKLSLDQIHML